MANLRVQRRRGERGDDGASLVEFALIMPLLFLLLLGTLTGGLTLSRQNSLKNAVRESSRYGAVLANYASIPASLTELYTQTVAAATGDLDVGTEGRVICVAMLDGNNWRYSVYDSAGTPVTNGATATPTAQSALPASIAVACDSSAVPLRPVSESPSVKRIWIRAARASQIEALFFSQDITLEAKGLSRFER